MPIYELQCTNEKCSNVQEELMGLGEMADRESENLDLSDINISCKKCGNTEFKRLISAHGKTAHNWSSWQRRGE